MDREAFKDFYCDFSDEDPEYVRAFLAERGIDVARLQSDLLELIAKFNAEQKLAKGREFRSVYEELKRKAGIILKHDTTECESSPAIAYRKCEPDDPGSSEENAADTEKLKLVREAREKTK